MMRSIQGLLSFLSFVLLFSGCSKKEFDEYYGRPDSLASPIYQQLQEKGNFRSLLKVIDKTTYKETLTAAGFWTFFAPTDQAFDVFLKESGYASVDEIPAAVAESIVRYSLAYDAEKKERLSDFFSRTGIVPGEGFRRRTLYYDFVYEGKDKSDKAINLIASNRNGSYLITDFNNKNIPVYTDVFMKKKNLGANDYEALYPGSKYSNFLNVGPANIVRDQYNIVAENGVIHAVDKVLTPPLSIDQYINSKAEFSEFRSLLDFYVSFNKEAALTQRYQVLTGKTGDVYSKIYESQLAFSPNNENYLKADANDAQQSMYSILAPTNEALTSYAKSVLLKYFPSGTSLTTLFGLKKDVVTTFINSHMFQAPLWPSKFSSTTNFLQERIKLDPSVDITDRKALSNGLFYGINKVHKANKFSTIYGNVYLDPKFSYMNLALDAYNHSIRLQVPSISSIVIPVSNQVFANLGYTYDPFYNPPFRYNLQGDNARLKRIIESHVVDHEATPVTDFSGQGYLRLTTIDPEYIKYKNGRLYSSGTLDSTEVAKQSVRIDSIRKGVDGTAENGFAVYASGVLMYTEKVVGEHIAKFGTAPTDPYYKFYQFLFNRTNIFNQTTKVITGVDLGSSYTVFIPTNAQIDEAVKDGWLPGTIAGNVVTPLYNPPAADLANIDKITRFILTHITKKTVTSDGRQGIPPLETLQKNQFGDPIYINVASNTTTSLKIKDSKDREANVVSPLDSYLSNRTIIHQIDKYLQHVY